jgi:putative oxidoreductase
MNPLDLVLLILRVVSGLTFLAHGVNHARNLEGAANWFAKAGFRAAPIQARLSAVVEIGAGALMAVGLLTQLAAMGLVATMTIAALAVHRFNGFFVFRPGEGWEYVHVLGWVGFVIVALGPGGYSLDAALGLGWGPGVGFALGGAGILAGILHLLFFWRRPIRPT